VTVTCPIGYSRTNSISPYRWKEIWGDGIRVGAELWDDGNTADNNGCNSNWGIVESNFICVGGTVTSSDTCTPWQTRYHPNGSPTSYKCVETWGDGLRYGEEICDDGNAANGDGCSSDCKTVESNYICVGGTQHHLTLEVNAQLAENPTLNLLLMIESLSAEMGEILMNCEMMEI
jgi:cysteine-rich repeat protein